MLASSQEDGKGVGEWQGGNAGLTSWQVFGKLRPEGNAHMDDQTRAALVYDAHKKSLLITYLLWWFLGAFGAHRFYLGAINSAVAMLVLLIASTVLTILVVGLLGFVVLGLWWLIDAFLIPGMVTRANIDLINRMR